MKKLIIEILYAQLVNFKSLNDKKQVNNTLSVYEIDNLKIFLDLIEFPTDDELHKDSLPHYFRKSVYKEFEQLMHLADPKVDEQTSKQNIDLFVKSICNTTKDYCEQFNYEINKKLRELLNHYNIAFVEYSEDDDLGFPCEEIYANGF